MPRWKKGETEFPVVVNHMRKRDVYSCSLPKPLLAHLGNPEVIVFVLKGKEVKIEVGV